jgi:hypothetical protein
MGRIAVTQVAAHPAVADQMGHLAAANAELAAVEDRPNKATDKI